MVYNPNYQKPSWGLDVVDDIGHQQGYSFTLKELHGHWTHPSEISR